MIVIRSFTLDRKSLLTKKTASASDGERDDDSITASEIAYVRPHFFDNAHELVSHYQRLGLRKKSVVEVQV